MSRETMDWLNNNTLIGFEDKRGKAWHWRKGSTNHYPGAIPVEDVRRRLFFWEPVAGPLQTTIDGKVYSDPDQQVIVRPDTGKVFRAFGSGYQIHSYNRWLIDYVATLLDADLAIGSAGMLQGGGVAWVQIELEDTVEHSSGVAYRPHLTAATSLNGTLKTTYVAGNEVVVCDNTLSAALGDQVSLQVKVKHSKRSLPKISQLRDALEIVLATRDEFSAALDTLTSAKVSDRRFERFLGVLNPVPQESGRSQTLAQNKNESLWGLWTSDPRVAPWRGTEWGVVQAVNTYNQHESIIRGQYNRAERNALNFLKGTVDELDLNTVKILAAV